MSSDERRGAKIEVRRARRGDEASLRQIRLRALTDAPTAFASSAEVEAEHPPCYWRELTAASQHGEEAAVFAAVGAQGWVGVVGARWSDRELGVVQLWGMWVEPAARGIGLGERLVAEVHGWAAGRGARSVRLGVIEGEAAARTLYARLGFTPTGETKPLLRDATQLARFLARPV